MPNSTHVRAIAVTSVEYSTPSACSLEAFAAAIATARPRNSSSRSQHSVSIKDAVFTLMSSGASAFASSEDTAFARVWSSSPIVSAFAANGLSATRPPERNSARNPGASTSRKLQIRARASFE
jgi:hypothetical protein